MPAAPIFSALHVTYSSNVHNHCPKVLSEVQLPLARSDLKWLPIKSARLLACGQNVNTVVELSLDNSDSGFEFHPGDTVGILPENDEVEVESLLQRLNVLSFSNNEYTLRWIEAIATVKETFPSHIPTIGSLKEVFQYFVDIRRVLSKTLINAISHFTRDPMERLTMERICNEKDLYMQEILQNNVSILTFLQKFPSCHPPVTLLLQHLPKLMPRPYSICSSSKINKDTIKICFSVIKLNNMLKGVTTGWLEKFTENILHVDIDYLSTMKENVNMEGICKNFDKSCSVENTNVTASEEIPIYLRQTTFRLPVDHTIPIVMIATGTGIAPFIGYLEERHIMVKNNPHHQLGLSQLYYGCRSEKDCLYKEQLQTYLQSGALTNLTVCYSRDPLNGMKYVQDAMELDKVNLTEHLLHSPTVFYICGSNSMAKSVEAFFCNAFKVIKQSTETDAKNLIKDLKKRNKYKLDIWI